MRFYLVGMPGCGKSTFGKRLSLSLGYSLIDLDTEIIRYAGKSIEKIFDDDGEDYFREIESCLLKSLSLGKKDFIMATGGGAPCFFDNMDFMNAHGITFYINASPAQLKERLSGRGLQKRPLLKHLDNTTLESTLQEKLDSRGPFYEMSKYAIPYGSEADQEMAVIINKLISEEESKRKDQAGN